MDDEYRLILACYRSGQMSEAQWTAHLSDPPFRQWYERLIAPADA